MKTVNVLAAKRLGIWATPPHTSLHAVADILTEEDISSLVVVDDNGYLLGIITRTDLLRAALKRPNDWRNQPASAWMTTNVVTIDPDATLQAAAEKLLEHCIHRVVVAQREKDKWRPIAVVSDGDIIYHLARRTA
ncbi:MAG: CBS domain-containing protein [Chloroflexi bacterium]|nr:CBS domain-containing protein [Chloroflexota bacterium]